VDSSIKFNVSANTAQFQSGMKQVDAVAKSTAAGIQQAFSGVQSMLVGGAALAGLKTLMNDFDKVAKVATRFGASAEEIQRVGVAADLAGTNIDTVARVLTKMSVAASDASSGNEAMAKAFERAGISAEQFKNSGLDQQLVLLSEAFNRARGDADATNQIIELMGTRAASQMIPLIDNTAALRAEMEGVSVASDEMVRKIEAANDRLTRLGNDGKVAIAGLIESFVNLSEKIGSVLAQENGLVRLINGIANAFRGNFLPLTEVLATAKTIAEMEEIEARATAIAQLTREGVFGMDAVKNAELIAERTKEILEQTRGTTQQISLAEDMTERVVDLEKQKTSELAKQAEQLERQEQRRQDAIRSTEAEVALIEAKLSGNKALEESLREQADFQSELAKTGSFETASKFAAAKAAERAAGESQSPQFATSGDRVFPGGLAERADPTQSQRVSQMRGEAASDRNMARFNELMEGRQFRSAARVEERARRAADRISTRQQMRDTMADMFDGAGNMGEALRNFENQSRKAGMSPDDALGRMGVNRGVGESRRDALERFINEQAKTPEERRMQEQQEQAGGKGGGGGQQNALTSIVRDIKSVLDELNKKLPQSALA
jgi:hypothetical protein